MAQGEFDSPSKPPSQAYRENWQRIFGQHSKLDPAFEPELCHQYPNGCPIIDESAQRQ